MTFDVDLATELISVEKRLAPADWVSDAQSVKLTCNFDGHHASIGRLILRVRISNGSMDKVSFTLLIGTPGVRQMQRVYALDLNPTMQHPNPFKLDDRDSGRIFRPGETHEHNFRDRIHDDDPAGFARPPTKSLYKFDDAADYICDTLKITRPPDFPKPLPQGQLL